MLLYDIDKVQNEASPCVRILGKKQYLELPKLEKSIIARSTSDDILGRKLRLDILTLKSSKYTREYAINLLNILEITLRRDLFRGQELR